MMYIPLWRHTLCTAKKLNILGRLPWYQQEKEFLGVNWLFWSLSHCHSTWHTCMYILDSLWWLWLPALIILSFLSLYILGFKIIMMMMMMMTMIIIIIIIITSNKSNQYFRDKNQFKNIHFKSYQTYTFVTRGKWTVILVIDSPW